MKNIHIISVGASIISNFKRKNNNLPDLSDDKSFEQVYSNDELIGKIFDFVNNNPYEASAELNSLKDFIEKQEVDEIHCIVTDTNIGKICYKILEKYLRSKKINITGKQPISGYYKEKIADQSLAEIKFVEGLKKLKDNLIDYIRNKQAEKDTKIYINATGGFKPEIVILTLVGSFTMTPVYYKHEFFGRNVFIPPLFLPYIRKEEANALKFLYDKETKSIVNPEINEFFSKYENVYDKLLSFNLIKEVKDEDDNLYRIELTSYGKFVCEISQ